MSLEFVFLSRILLSAVLGILIGLERTMACKRAGMRTFALVSMGSTLFVLIGEALVATHVDVASLGEVTRIPAAIISGIGFLGAGMILVKHDVLRGLTTAAGLWVTAGVGIAVGFGMYYVAIFTVLITLLIFTAVWLLEAAVKKYTRHYNSVIIAESEEDVFND